MNTTLKSDIKQKVAWSFKNLAEGTLRNKKLVLPVIRDALKPGKL